jgi:hypothetical protein
MRIAAKCCYRWLLEVFAQLFDIASDMQRLDVGELTEL